MRTPDYYERRVDELRLKLLPRDGSPANSIQGELIRHAYHLFDDGYRRGFAHWATSGELALDFLRRFLPDPRVFDAGRIAAIRDALDRIIEAGPNAGLGLPLADLRVLLHRAVDWCDHHPHLVPLPRS